MTFRVDMTEEEVSATGVWVIGNFTNPNWQAGAIQMTDDDMDGVYEVTVNISGSATILYKFTNGDPTTGDNGVDFVEESGICWTKKAMSLPILKRTAAACRMDLVRTTASTSAAVSLDPRCSLFQQVQHVCGVR